MNTRHVAQVVVSVVVASAVMMAGIVARAGEVRIVAADGRYAPDGRVQQVLVRPGQVVSLAADEVSLDASGRVLYARRAPEDFAWQAVAVDRWGVARADQADRCDPAVGCAAGSAFEATPYGVNYYVPWNPPDRIRIRASLKWGPASDVVDLVNEASEGEAGRPAWESELDGLGYWVRIADQRVFVPVVYVAGWAPYRHGVWYWTAFGWTWYSFDPWGTITDHCGHWRHHRWYGWVWVPDPVCVWRPAVVTFFYGPLWVGWYPYDPGWTWGYWYGYEHGYDDGYWFGYAVGRAAGEGRASPGFVATTYEDFCPGSPDDPAPEDGKSGHAPRGPGETASRPAGDRFGLRFADPVAANEAFNDAVRKGHVGPVPGGGSDPKDGWKFWARKTGFRPVEVPVKEVAGRPGTGRWFEPATPPAGVPARYHEAATRIRVATGAARIGERLRGIGVGQALDAVDVRSERPGRGVVPPPAEVPSRPDATVAEPPRPARAPSPPASQPEEPVRIPPRQDVPREYRVVPAEPPVAPTTRRVGGANPPLGEPTRTPVSGEPSRPRLIAPPRRQAPSMAPPSRTIAPTSSSSETSSGGGSARPVSVPPATSTAPAIRKVAPALRNAGPGRLSPGRHP